MGIKSYSIGIQGDAAAVIAGGVSVGVAYDTDFDKSEGYWGTSDGSGFAVGASVAPEIGFWLDKPKNLAGDFFGVELGAAYVVGVEMGFYFDFDFNFLGFNVVPGVGKEIDVRAVQGETRTFDV